MEVVGLRAAETAVATKIVGAAWNRRNQYSSISDMHPCRHTPAQAQWNNRNGEKHSQKKRCYPELVWSREQQLELSIV